MKGSAVGSSLNVRGCPSFAFHSRQGCQQPVVAVVNVKAAKSRLLRSGKRAKSRCSLNFRSSIGFQINYFTSTLIAKSKNVDGPVTMTTSQALNQNRTTIFKTQFQAEGIDIVRQTSLT